MKVLDLFTFSWSLHIYFCMVPAPLSQWWCYHSGQSLWDDHWTTGIKLPFLFFFLPFLLLFPLSLFLFFFSFLTSSIFSLSLSFLPSFPPSLLSFFMQKLQRNKERCWAEVSGASLLGLGGARKPHSPNHYSFHPSHKLWWSARNQWTTSTFFQC